MGTMDRSREEGRPPENQADTLSQASYPSKVIADFGGRRKIFDRRLRQIPIAHAERRSGGDRRSGFDRRSATGQKGELTFKRRNDDFTPPADPNADRSI